MAYEASNRVLTEPSKEARLEQRITDRTAKAGVIGLGYVGLPLVVEIAKGGFEVVGLDMDLAKVRSVNDGLSYIPDVSSTDLAYFVGEQKIRATESLDELDELDAPQAGEPFRGLLGHAVQAVFKTATHTVLGMSTVALDPSA